MIEDKIEFIKNNCIHPQVFMTGGCFLFAVFLKAVLMDGELYYNGDHVVLGVDGELYDINGKVNSTNFLPLKEFGPTHLKKFQEKLV